MKHHQETDKSNMNKGCCCDHPDNPTQQSPCNESTTQMSSQNGEGLNQQPIPGDIYSKQMVDKLQQELATANDKYLRLYAEFENFRKRNTQEKLALIETAGEIILQLILPIIDDFERALTALHQKNVSVEAVEQGVELIHDKMMHLLEQAGAQAMKLEKGGQFDPELHEAITKTPVSDVSFKGKIVDIIEKGYLLKNKVLRYAKVIIGE